MPDKEEFRIEWTTPSLEDILSIRRYLSARFSEKEVSQFYSLVADFEKSVIRFPKLYPEFSLMKRLRRAVLNKNLSVYYSIKNRKVVVVSVLDNRMDYSKLL